MFEGVIGLEQLQLGQQVVSQLVGPVGGVELEPANQAGETGIGTVFNILEIVRWTLLGIVISLAGIFGLWGTILLLRGATNPQVMERAKAQIVVSFVASGIAVGIFVGIGAVIDLMSTASGGTTLDVGDVSKVQNTGRVVPVGTFLGMYGGKAYLCPSLKTTHDDFPTDVTTAWTYTEAVAATATTAAEPAKCTKA